jgi:hypothetical protein
MLHKLYFIMEFTATIVQRLHALAEKQFCGGSERLLAHVPLKAGISRQLKASNFEELICES